MEMQSDAPNIFKPSEQDFNLVQQSHDEFNREDYDKCLETLEQLEATRGSSSTLKHNRAVVQFYKSECKDHGALLKVLNELDKEETSPLASYPSPIACYNKAVIYFHRHMRNTAMETLAPLINKLEKLDEHIAALVGILMLRLLLVTNQFSKAQAFLELLQQQLDLSIENVSAASDETASLETLSNLYGCTRTFKLLALITNVLNRKTVVVPDDGSAEMAALKAHQYYIMKDFQMAAKQLKKINSETLISGSNVDELNTCIANNMGVIHLRVRHYAIAAKFFQNAITFDQKIAANLRNAPLQHMSSARSCEILYNLGIAMLHLRRPKEAFQCFLVPLKSYHSNPRLWFRMAEACLMEHEMKIIAADKRPMMKGTIQIGSRKHYVIKPSPRVVYSESSQSAAVPEPTLEFAVLSLRNALTMTKFYRSSFNKPTEDETGTTETETRHWRQVKDNNFGNPSRPVSKKSLDNMLLAIYAAYSYVSLRIGDYSKAFEMAQELLRAENLTDAHKVLAHMYAGEALIMMDKLSEARAHLDPTFVSSLNAFDFETKDWQVKSLDAAQNIVRYNLAVAMVLQGDLETARNLLNSCKHPIVVHKLKSLHVYLNLRTGNYT